MAKVKTETKAEPKNEQKPKTVKLKKDNQEAEFPENVAETMKEMGWDE